MMTRIPAVGRLLMVMVIFGIGTVQAETIRGYVLHSGTQKRVADVEVAFLIGSEDGSMSPMAQTQSDAEGRFDFSGPFLERGTRFALSAEVGGVSYPSSALIVGEQEEIIVEIYDVDQDASQITVSNHNLFLGVRDQTLEVAHLVQVDNGGNRTYAGPVFDGQTRGIEFVVPAKLSALTAHTGELVRFSATRVFDSQPVPPGPSQIAFTFQIRPDAFDGTYVHEVVYPTTHLDVFVQPVSVELDGTYEDLGVIDLHGQQYRHYRAHDLEAGKRLAIDLPVSRPLRWALKWALLALVPAILIGVVAVARRPVRLDGGAPQPARADTDPATGSGAETERLQILKELAHVQDARARADDAQRIELDRQHASLMQRAREIYRKLPPS